MITRSTALYTISWRCPCLGHARLSLRTDRRRRRRRRDHLCWVAATDITVSNARQKWSRLVRRLQAFSSVAMRPSWEAVAPATPSHQAAATNLSTRKINERPNCAAIEHPRDSAFHRIGDDPRRREHLSRIVRGADDSLRDPGGGGFDGGAARFWRWPRPGKQYRADRRLGGGLYRGPCHLHDPRARHHRLLVGLSNTAGC